MDVDRPSVSEDVEDLERQQERFLASGDKPAATIKRLGADGKSEPTERKKSRFREARERKGKVGAAECGQLQCQPVLVDLVERPGSAIYVPDAPRIEDCVVEFPKPVKRTPGLSGDGMSIFMKSFNAHKPMDSAPKAPQSSEEIDELYVEIQRENTERLGKMSREDILSAQAELLKKLDPNLVKFIRDKGTRPKSKVETIVKTGSQIDDALLHELLQPTVEPDIGPSTEEFVEDELPIPPESVEHFPHMEVVEKDKLAWMTNLPEPRKSSKHRRNFVCRFDFDGCLLPEDADIPTHKALHHHGDEPERAGYTTNELFTFLSSSVQSQRILGLQVLSNIFSNHHAGRYDEFIPGGVLQSLIDNGMMTLLRVSLDDQSATQLSESIRALRNLLSLPHDETCLDLITDWVDEEPFMAPSIKILSQRVDVNELRDEELIREDVVKGLLRMDILPRVRYVLEVCQLDTAAVGCALELLIRIARHSPEAADRIAGCPRLCTFVVDEYLPLYGWNTPAVMKGKLASSGGVPLALAMKFIRVLCAASKTVATTLLVDHSLERTIGVYLSIDLSEGLLPRREVMSLQLETLRLLKVFLRHSLCLTMFDNLSPIVNRQLSYAEQISAARTSKDEQLFDLSYASCLMQCLHARIRSISVEEEPDWTPIAPSIVESLKSTTRRWLHQLRTEQLGVTAMGSLAVALRLLADLRFSKHDVDVSEVVASLGQLIEDTQKFASLIDTCISTSMLLRPTMSAGQKRDPSALPSLGSIQFGNHSVIPLANEHQSIFLLDAMAYFLWTCVELGIRCPSATTFVQAIKEYLVKITTRGDLTDGWFARTEMAFLYRIVRLFAKMMENPTDHGSDVASGADKDLFRETALAILPYLPADRSASISHLLSQIVFAPSFYSEASVMSLSQLRLHKIRAPFGDSEIDISDEDSLIRDIFSHLPSLLQSAKEMLYFLRGSIPAKYLDASLTHTSQSVYMFEGGLLPKDWVYLPLRFFYADVSTIGKPADKGGNDDPALKQKAREAEEEDHLKWTLSTLRTALLLNNTSGVISKLPPVVNFVRLATVFLIDPSTFLNEDVYRLLAILFMKVIVPNAQKLNIDSIEWPALPAFTDFYALMLKEFEAYSYCNPIFTAYLLCPQQTCYHVDLRRVFYIEHETMFQMITVDERDLLGIPMRSFLEPRETDRDVLTAFRSALQSRSVTKQRNPFLYKLFSHHLAAE